MGEQMTETVTDTIADRVQRGVAWLDANGPADWSDRVDLTDFSMSHTCRCVLGWTFAVSPLRGEHKSGFAAGIHLAAELKGEVPEWGQEWAIDHGFDAMNADPDSLEWGALQDAWEAVIRSHRGGRRGGGGGGAR